MSSLVAINGAAPETARKEPDERGNQQVPQQLVAPRTNKPIRLKNHSVCSETYDTLHRVSSPVRSSFIFRQNSVT